MKASQLDPSPASQTKMAQDMATAIDTFVKKCNCYNSNCGTASVCMYTIRSCAGATVKGSGTVHPM